MMKPIHCPFLLFLVLSLSGNAQVDIKDQLNRLIIDAEHLTATKN